MECYFYVSKATNPYRNLALEELLLRQCKPNQVLLYLWQNDNTVVIGRNQNAWRECRLEAFVAQKGYLARRMTGGGAVYHDLGNQNFSFIAGKACYHLPRQTEVILKAVRRFSLDAEQSGRNDLLVQGKKFSGNAYYKTENAALQHGTILISSDLSRLEGYLAPSPEKLQSKGVKSVRERVINLSELNPEVTPVRMRAALLQAFAEVYQSEPKPFPLEEIDGALWEKLTKHYESEEWRLNPVSDFQIQLQKRLSFGELEVLLQVESGVVKEAKVYSDAMDSDWVRSLEAALEGTCLTPERLAKAVPEGEWKKETAQYLSSLSF